MMKSNQENLVNKEQRTVFLATLTIFFLALSNLLNTGKFIFTFPMNDFILLAVSFYFFFLNFKENKLNSFLLVLFALLNFVNNFYNLELFLNSEQMTKLSESLIPDFCYLGTFLVYFILFIRYNLEKKNLFSWIFLVLALFCAVISQMQIVYYIYYLTFLFLPIALVYNKDISSRYYKSIYYFFLLFGILNVTKIFTFFLS